MKPFDIEAAKRGERVVIREGQRGQIDWDKTEQRYSAVGRDDILIVALDDGPTYFYTPEGQYKSIVEQSHHDLRMADDKGVKYLRLYLTTGYCTEAVNNIEDVEPHNGGSNSKSVIAKVTWREE